MKKIFFVLLFSVGSLAAIAQQVYRVSDFGLRADGTANASPIISKLIDRIKAESTGKRVVLEFEPGQYHFYPQGATVRDYYISNHDQTNPKTVGLALENVENLTLEGNGAEFIFHGRMLPIALVNGTNCTVRNLTIDFAKPHIAQVTVVDNDTTTGQITLEVAPWVDYEIRNNAFINKGKDWENQISSCIAFDGTTRQLVYRTSDIDFGRRPTTILSDRRIQIQWRDTRLVKGTVLALRSWYRPAPGVFVADSKDTQLENVTVHYAEGMGLLAQMSENITLKNFKVALRGEHDPRYFTTQADATHFSGCKGRIVSTGGMYENMMDDAINIHGTYLKIVKRVDDHTVEAAYMHSQSWGFRWGEIGDQTQFVAPSTMELVGGENTVAAIRTMDKPTVAGAKLFEIRFEQPLDASIMSGCGIENLTWTPRVYFADNVIRNNRARGALFSTPRKTVVENNVFHLTSGTAILLCGDCNGWFETGACRDITIRKNVFYNALTSLFQFTNGVISIYPEIPDLAGQRKYFHGGHRHSILIERNTFETFDKPLVYAKSVDGLTFRKNSVVSNSDYPAFHWIRTPFYFERVVNSEIKDNVFDYPFDGERDIVIK